MGCSISGLPQTSHDGCAKFVRRYSCTQLVYAEPPDRIEEAIAREKAMKAWPRLWKLRLIQEQNPEWRDLFEELII